MEEETIIKPLCLGNAMTVKVAKSVVIHKTLNFKTGSTITKDVFKIIHESENYSSSQPIPKQVYNALIAWQQQIDKE
ncbi:hypothetical protein [Psychrobacter sp. I-STPA10]|uniref:hypothetical protein n=1 Tax=Psychrobacter sp. I-STPA10 TaxID=2585769 RepID=UPI001E3B7187|nr:hypothetical protein [Psychrobacter sp. I-STPA10]